MAFETIKALAVHAAAALALASCSQHTPSLQLKAPPSLPSPRRALRTVPLPEWFWEPVEVDLRGAPRAVDLPLAELALTRVEGATRVWDDLGDAGRERLRRDGLVVLANRETPRVHMGAFYMDMRDQRVPYLVTLDALAYVVHLAFEQALAEVDSAVLAPELERLLARLEARLSSEQKGAGVELGEALRLARGVVGVALALAHSDHAAPASSPAAAPFAAPAPSPAAAPSELAPVIAEEVARIFAHGGRAPSPLLGAPIDYARFVVPSAAGRPGAFLALAWLASAPLLLAAQSEVAGAAVGVATSRLHARAAMLLARVSTREVDAGVYDAWSRIARLLTFVWGPPDDLSPPELAALASALGVTLEDPKSIADVVTVDRLRHRAARGRQPLVFDGAGAPGRAGIGMRLFGGHAPPDTVALASLVSAASPRGSDPAADRARSLPAALDLAVWLGASEARASLHEGGGDAWPGYDAALVRAIGARPGEEAPSRHSSVHGSLLDVVMTWLAPREGTALALASPAAQRAAVESALAVWTFARHADQPLSRARPPSAAPRRHDLRVSGAALPAFVEAAPEVIARLVATVAQMKRGLAAIAGLPATSPAMVALAEVDDMLRAAMRAASRQVNDEALAPEDIASLASFPARIASLEEQAESGGASVPVVAEMMVDVSGERVLSTATGEVESAVTVVREPGTGRLVLVVGAHVAHHELVEPRPQQSRDQSHRARFLGVRGVTENRNALLPARGAYTSTFRMVR
jgi:hypothetical protein